MNATYQVFERSGMEPLLSTHMYLTMKTRPRPLPCTRPVVRFVPVTKEEAHSIEFTIYGNLWIEM